ncbi:hypothetical protein GCM10027079_16800 [Sediminivirga luteola]|uniref:Uncharacterized protein n=1 Tax=Sediminivirga luteola TaxID=1774748 RepID=A0A8J2TVK7_9MICO|nr:hypothetical protein GCM10011333_04260 [Sediminivirga luteola]
MQQEGAAGLGEDGSGAAALHEGDSQMAFECPQMVAHGGLAEVQLTGGPRKGPGALHGVQDGELTKIQHPYSIWWMAG